MKRTKGKPKLICIVEKSLFRFFQREFPTVHFYGGIDGKVYAIYPQPTEDKENKSGVDYVLVDCWDRSYDYDKEIASAEIGGRIEPLDIKDDFQCYRRDFEPIKVQWLFEEAVEYMNWYSNQ